MGKTMNEKNLVSVIIPTWNRQKQVVRAIKSTLNQSYNYIEILVCDDGSTDNTKEVITEMSKKDKRIKWIPGEHTGLPAIPRNRGIKHSSGEWIAFLDSDDYWDKTKIYKQLKRLKEKKLLASCTNGYKDKDIFYKNIKKEEFTFEDLIKNNNVIASSTLINKELLIKTGKFPIDKELKAIEDYQFWLRISSFTNFAYVDEPLIYYNNNVKTSIRKNSLPYLRQKQIIYKHFILWNKWTPSIFRNKVKTLKHMIILIINKFKP